MCRNSGALMLQYCQISDDVRKHLRCCPRTPRSSASAPGEARVPEPTPACVSMGLLSPHLKFTKKEGNHCICMRPSLRAFVNAAQKFVTTMEGKTILITGATDGIGQHTAIQLAKMGASVLVHGRNQQKADAAAQKISKTSGGRGYVHSYAADMSSLRQVRDLAERVRKDHPSIDILINNAGIFPEKKILTEDGYEQTWAVNVLAPFLLTSLLVDAVKERIVNVSSISAGSRIDFDNLNQEKGFSSHNAYSLSKLAMMMFNAELAARVPAPPTANCLDPGTVNTKMLIQGWGPCGIDIEDANHELFLATSPAVANTTGKYFVSDRARSMPSIVQDAKTRQRLWNILEEQTGSSFPA